MAEFLAALPFNLNSHLVLISPTKYKYQATKIPAILDFNHRCSKLEMTVDCVDGFIYQYHICKIAIFGFLSETVE